MRWITACELALRRSRLSSRKVIWAVERDRVRTFSSSIRTALSGRSAHTRSCGRWPSTQPWRSLSSASAAASRCASAAVSAASAATLASPASLAAASQSPALRLASAASRSLIAWPICSAANRRAPCSVAFWICVQGVAERLVGGGDLADRDLELDAGVDVGHGQAVGAQDLRPEVGIAEMLLRQIAQALAFLEADGQQVAVRRHRGRRLQHEEHRQDQSGPPAAVWRSALLDVISHALDARLSLSLPLTRLAAGG